MSLIADRAEEYLALRHALGHKIAETGRLLPRFVTYLEAAGSETVTLNLALDWAMAPPGGGPPSTVWGRRMSVARAFSRHLTAFDARTEVPPAGLLAVRADRRVFPYLYSDSDVAALMVAARALTSPLRAATYETLIGLLAVTGMRIGEVLRLDRADLEWNDGALVVRESKFGKSRRLPLQASTIDALALYEDARDALFPTPSTPAFFIARNGNRLIYSNVLGVFHDLLDRTGVGRDALTGRPRLHGFRHSFAVATLLDWYRRGVDVHARMPWLSTYLGHSSPSSTFWYLSAAPELMALAAERLEVAIEARR